MVQTSDKIAQNIASRWELNQRSSIKQTVSRLFVSTKGLVKYYVAADTTSTVVWNIIWLPD